jgi:hypothetical protein
VEPVFSRQYPSAHLFRSLFTALRLAAGGGAMSATFSINPQEVFITAISLIVIAISPSRSPHREYGGRLIGGNR